MQQMVQHGQETLALPDFLPAMETFGQVVPGGFVMKQGLQCRPRQAPQGGGQGRPDKLVCTGVGHRPHKAPQVNGLRRGKHTVSFRQVDAAHAPRCQGTANGPGLRPAAHQHRHVAGLGRALVEQADHVRGKQCRHLPQEHLLARGFGVVQVPHRHGGLRLSVHGQWQHLVVAGHHRLEWHFAKGLVGVREHMVDRRHHACGGSEVARQGVDGLRLVARGQIGVEVGPAKAVDGLLGVANQDQPGVRRGICRR